jgi:hypothetical protein
LHGRSAIAAADLWRERIFMYDRFYLAPELRVAERMAFEIIQQYLIRTTMSSLFAKKAIPQSINQRYLDATEKGLSLGDSITPKYDAACSVMRELQDASEQPELEFATLTKMNADLQECRGIDSKYRSFLNQCFGILVELAEQNKELRVVADECIVQRPILFDRSYFERAREIIRPLQHTYCREALIDLIRIPKVLSGPRSTLAGPGNKSKAFECPIIVPNGAVEHWSKNDRASTPLTDVCVQRLEIPICRAIVISPDGNRSKRVQYIWERVRSVLLDEGIDIMVAEQ